MFSVASPVCCPAAAGTASFAFRALRSSHSTLNSRLSTRGLKNSAATSGSVNPAPTMDRQKLLLFVRKQHCWHESSKQLAAARRAVAEHVIQAAHKSLPSHTLNLARESYAINCAEAGSIMLAALEKAGWSPSQPRPYSTMQKAFVGDAFLSVVKTGPSEYSIQLDIMALVSAAQQYALAPAAVSVEELLAYICSRHWHTDMQLAVVRQAVAQHLVSTANNGQPTLQLDPAAYRMTGGEAGELMRKALQERLGWQYGDPKSYNKLQKAFDGDPYLSTQSSKRKQLKIQLDIIALVGHVAAAPASAIGHSLTTSPVLLDYTIPDLVEPQRLLDEQLVSKDHALQIEAPSAIQPSTPQNSRHRLFSDHDTGNLSAVASSRDALLAFEHHNSGWYLPVYTAQQAGTSSGLDDTSSMAADADDFAAEVDSADWTDEFAQSILQLLPASLQEALQPYTQPDPDGPNLVEIMADSGHPVQIKLSDHTVIELAETLDIPDALSRLAAARQAVDDGSSSVLSSDEIGSSERDAAGARVDYDSMFGSDNRMGVPGTLHRIAAMRDRKGNMIGLTYRVGRHVPGVALMLADVLSSMKASLRSSQADRPQSLLVLGKPGVGKTTLLRDIARIMSLPPAEGGLGLAVVIVDTSNEIAGDADQRHPCIGRARRMMVPRRDQQAAVLVEAVQNHGPDVIIVDEIGTEQEVDAARTIAQRGVLMVGTAHGGTLSNLLKNPELRPLIGGVQPVTLGDATAKASNFGQKTKLERVGPATFLTLLELQQKDRWRLHPNVEESVDVLLGAPPASAGLKAGSMDETYSVNTQLRSRIERADKYKVVFETRAAAQQANAAAEELKLTVMGHTVGGFEQQ